MLKDKREIPLFPAQFLMNPSETEKKAIDLSNFLNFYLKSIWVLFIKINFHLLIFKFFHHIKFFTILNYYLNILFHFIILHIYLIKKEFFFSPLSNNLINQKFYQLYHLSYILIFKSFNYKILLCLQLHQPIFNLF